MDGWACIELFHGYGGHWLLQRLAHIDIAVASRDGGIRILSGCIAWYCIAEGFGSLSPFVHVP